MSEIVETPKMKFEYSGAPQKSPEWFAIRRGKVTASKLQDWLSVSKAKGKPGTPLKARLDYEKELMFERQFNTSFEVFVNDAMQDGIDYEDFGRKQYELITGNKCEEVGCWYNDWFVASPDRAVKAALDPEGNDSEDGLLEIKILKDNSFTEVLAADPATSHYYEVEGEKGKKTKVGTGVPEKHWKQIQGQLWSSKREWCDYVAVNFNTKKIVVIRVYPDQEFHDYLELAVPEKLVTKEFALTNVFDIVGELPNGIVIPGADLDRSDSNLTMGDWSR